MTIPQYIEKLNTRYKSGISRENSYRGDLQRLLETLLDDDILVTNEPARVKCGAPDYILTKGKIPVCYIEAKDIGDPDLAGKKRNKEQFNRYKATGDPFIFTDYLDFRFYNNDEHITSIRIAEVENGKIAGKPDKYDRFKDLIREFATPKGQTIRSSAKLSKMMAGKARLLANVIENALIADEEKEEANKAHEAANITLREQLAAFQDVLIHDIDAKEFADIYAQTIAYGMFAARLHDPTLDTFSRQEAAELIPKTNPFLRKLFQYIAGYDLDDRIAWIVDGLADIFRSTDVEGLLKNFGKATKQHDPVIHFYETFLAEYDPTLRKSRGVWYTPEPVVNFIVRAVDDILKEEFDLKDGLADTTKTKIKVKKPTHDGRYKEGMAETEEEVHKVQILDPAAGTGTFLAEVIKQIHKRFDGQQGIWAKYVEEHLIPRLNGFEILMASYAMAHLKLDLLLRETGVEPSGSERFRVYLTNSMEEHHPDTGTLFANWLSQEANEANRVKRDTPVMVVLGNPPYSISSKNKGEWIERLMKEYKKNLDEINIQPLSDDYLKFIRYGQYLVDKNGEGVLAYVSNNSFLDGLIHRQMRSSITESFSKIYIIDLHGSSNRKEVAPDGSKDENVFDIQQGVSINIFIKKSDKFQGSIKHIDLYGSRSKKYEFLSNKGIYNVNWEEIQVKAPKYFFIPRDYKIYDRYKEGFPINELFNSFSSGITTERDDVCIQYNSNDIEKIIKALKNHEIEDFRNKFTPRKDGRDWKVAYAKDDILENPGSYTKIQYRPFDYRSTYYTGNSKGFMAYPRHETSKELLKPNVALVTSRQTKDVFGAFLTDKIMTHKILTGYDRSYFFPLYTYPLDDNQQTIESNINRKPNLSATIIKNISNSLQLKFSAEKTEDDNYFDPLDLLDYIYASLNSPTYTSTYSEFLKTDFPRIAYPEDPDTFWQLVELGGELRKTHLLEHPVVNDFITTYPESGSNYISKRLTKTDPGFIPDEEDESIGKVWINEEQYFGQVPKLAWEFYIGGYHPAQKWLKDRRKRELSFEEIQHYQRIVVALVETDRLMGEIDNIDI